MKTWKRCLPDVLVVLCFALVSFAYFFPADLDGKILYRHDSAAGKGAGQEIADYRQRTGKISRWSSSVFSGMPTYQTAPAYSSQRGLGYAVKAYHLFLPEYVWYLFAYLLGFYILLRAFDFRWHLAALGSVMWAFSSYFLIIIAAGHIWKVMALAYLPPLIGGVVLAFRRKYLLGFIVTAIFSAFEVNANHVQMTYYFLFVIGFMLLCYLVDCLHKRQMRHFLRAFIVSALGGLLGIMLNISNLYHTWEYSKESMRSKSELIKADQGNQTNSGLDRDYITQWSYGIGETWTLLVPNTKGGASVPLSESEVAMRKANPEFQEIYQQLGQYWGEQPGTSGPVYVGAFVLLLFFLGLFIVKGPVKWAMLLATVLSVMLSWGRNFMPLTDFFIDFVPMYAKFRTVASILVVAEFTIPLLAMLALKEIVDKPKETFRKKKSFLFAFILTGGVAFLFAVMPSVFFEDFISTGEMRALQAIPEEYLAPMLANLRDMRIAIFTADCWRSLLIILIGCALLLLFKYGKIKATTLVGLILALCLVDMWQVDKRYLNNSMFVQKSLRDAPVRKTEADEYILKDKSQCGNYRVLNFASNTFNENETSYYHKSIGGYHAAKLRRYQELIDAYIAPEMRSIQTKVVEAAGDMSKVNGDSIMPVVDMLNAKYFIFPLQDGKTVPIKNTHALGNAWFVDQVVYKGNANEELSALGKVDLRHTAVADKHFESVLGQSNAQSGTSLVTIEMAEPDELLYNVKSETGGVVVFSEIYYPGWEAFVDGDPQSLGRVNYVLRALQVGKGEHKVRLVFHPKSIDRTETVAYVGYVILLLCIAFIVFFELKRGKKEQADGQNTSQNTVNGNRKEDKR